MMFSRLLRSAHGLIFLFAGLLPAISQVNWSAPVSVSGAQAEMTVTSPEVAAGDNGNIVTAWLQTRPDNTVGSALMIGTSTDGGATYQQQVLYPDYLVDAWVNNSGVKLSYAGQNVFVCAWNARRYKDFNYGSLVGYYSRSTDGGLTWSEPLELPAEGSASQPFDIAANTDTGTVIITVGRYIMRSVDRGGNWEKHIMPVIPGMLATDEPVDWFLYNSVAAGSDGVWLLGHHGYYDRQSGDTGERIIVSNISRSTDHGVTWSSVWTKFGDDIVYFNDISFDGPEAVALVSSYYGTETYAMHSADAGLTWTSGGLSKLVTADLYSKRQELQLARTSNHWVVTGVDNNARFSVVAVHNQDDWGITPFPYSTYLTDWYSGSGGAITVLPDGNLAAVYAGVPASGTDWAIWSQIFSSTPQPPDAADLAFLPPAKPLLAKIDKDGFAILKTKLKVANNGGSVSDVALVRFYFSSDDKFDSGDQLLDPKDVFIKPVKAAKPGKAPKKKSLSAKLVPHADSGYIIAELHSATEPASPNNIIVLPYQPK